MYIVGIDIGKRNHEASIMNAAGKQYGKPIRFANSHTGFNKLMDWVKNISGADDVVFGMEATGHYWLALYTHLCHEGYAVHVINAVQSDALRGMYIRQAKNDSRDSFIIAEVIRFGRFCETAVSAPELHALRELCRHRFWIVDSVSDLKRKVIALLDQVFPEYENLLPIPLGRLLYNFSPNTRHRKNCLPLIRTNWQRRFTPPAVVTMALRKPRRFKTPHAIPSGSCWLPIPLPFSSANTSNRFASWKNRLIESTQKSHVCFLLLTTNLPPLQVLAQP